jgi:hypothetical protein
VNDETTLKIWRAMELLAEARADGKSREAVLALIHGAESMLALTLLDSDGVPAAAAPAVGRIRTRGVARARTAHPFFGPICARMSARK